MDDAIKQTLIKTFGQMAVEVSAELEPTYGAAIARMAVKEAIALEQLINAKMYASARDLIRSKMTQQELADEASSQAGQWFSAAVENEKAWTFTSGVVGAGLKVLLAIALGSVGL